ncbi:MAG: hypothetical protein M1495_19865 [Bacteroidetes bacterium]|nr:hypothetical protein [Bacteroidota bacterium]
MRYNLFCVDEIPYCIWDGEYQNINSEYIKRVEPHYYEYVAQSNYDIINDSEADKESKQFAAISLRSYYTQAMETLFALIFATLQAPTCIPGWMMKYKNYDLYKLVEKTDNNIPLKIRFTKVENISWNSIIKLIFHYFDEKEIDAKNIIVKNFTDLLSSFASDYLDKNLHNEYNSVKHGLRAKAGGSVLAIKEVDKEGKPKDNSEWTKILHSDYGSSFYIDEKLLDSKNHFRLKYHSNNWNPEDIFYEINFISLLLHNLLTFLKIFNKIESDSIKYKSVSPEDAFKTPWKNLIGTGNITMDFGFDYKSIKLFSNDEILASYDFKKDDET